MIFRCVCGCPPHKGVKCAACGCDEYIYDVDADRNDVDQEKYHDTGDDNGKWLPEPDWRS
jgi:hypothetical protein